MSIAHVECHMVIMCSPRVMLQGKIYYRLVMENSMDYVAIHGQSRWIMLLVVGLCYLPQENKD